MAIGTVLVAIAIGAALIHYRLPFENLYAGAVGGLLLVVGLIFFIAEIFETWLSRSQSALVDGLQAG